MLSSDDTNFGVLGNVRALSIPPHKLQAPSPTYHTCKPSVCHILAVSEHIHKEAICSLLLNIYLQYFFSYLLYNLFFFLHKSKFNYMVTYEHVIYPEGGVLDELLVDPKGMDNTGGLKTSKNER